MQGLTRRVSAVVAAASILAGAALAAACSEDDGAAVRGSGGTGEAGGSVRIIGPPPPEGGGSVSATGSGCTTRGATTKLPAASVEIGLDEATVTAPPTIGAGVSRLVVKNFASEPRGLVVTAVSSAAEVTGADGRIDENLLAGRLTKRLEAFPGNTICEATFDLPAGTYLLFDPERIGQGMVVVVTAA